MAHAAVVLTIALLAGGLFIAGARAQTAAASRAATVVGLDHIPIAVENLERAAERYRALGFVLKPGSPHANGIRNEHVKFPDGTELELITAPDARDELTTVYRQHLARGDGPAFLALHAPSLEASRRKAAPPYIFFGRLNHSPTDRPEHFAHPNGADSLIGVWLAGDDLSRERELVESMGASISRRTVRVPDAMNADAANLGEGSVVFLPGERQLVPGRRIVGATLRVKSLAAARAGVERTAGTSWQIATGPGSSSIFLPPALTHGLWLELRAAR